MKKKIIIGIIIAAVVIAAFMLVSQVLRIFGYVNPVERYYYKLKTNAALEAKYPGHDFNVVADLPFGEYGFSLVIKATDEEGIDFTVHWAHEEMEDHYHEEWNEAHYGKEIAEYQNSLKDKYFPQIPYVDSYEYYPYESYHFYRGLFKEEFFESLDEAIEGSKYNNFDTKVTFGGIDLDTADDAELEKFAGSIADSLIWLNKETGYYDIRINSFHYRAYDESSDTYTPRDDLVESIIKNVKLDRSLKK